MTNIEMYLTFTAGTKEGTPYYVTIVIHDTSVNDNSKRVHGAKLVEAVNEIPSLSFDVYPDNAGFAHIKAGTVTLGVTRTTDSGSETMFSGRCLSVTSKMDSNGKVYKSCVFEGDLGYLHDTIQEPLDPFGSSIDRYPFKCMQTVLSRHNADSDFQLAIGDVDTLSLFEDGSGYSDYCTTWDALQTLFVDNQNAEIRLRQEDGINYIDCKEEFSEASDTVIELGKNLKEMTVYEDVSRVITRLYPLGGYINDDEDNPRLNIKPYTASKGLGGLLYVQNDALVNTYGVRCGVVIFDVPYTDTAGIVTQSGKLYRKGVDYLNKQTIGVKRFTISALDLSCIDKNYEEFKLYGKYRAVNSLLGIDEYLRVVGRTYDFDNPQQSTITIGEKVNTLTKIISGR